MGLKTYKNHFISNFDIFDGLNTILSLDKAFYPKISSKLLELIIKYGPYQPFEK